jgi:hypothetical protein
MPSRTSRMGSWVLRGRPVLREILGAFLQHIGESIYRLADWAMYVASRNERVTIPPSFVLLGSTVDVLDDLVKFTHLPREIVAEALVHRRPTSFRNEWFSTPRTLRTDDWFYLSSKAYLFANAAHFGDDDVVDFVASNVPKGGSTLAVARVNSLFA